jgi:hypothetical protein
MFWRRISPSLAPDAPRTVVVQNVEVQQSRMALVQAAEEIPDLALGPDDLLLARATLVRCFCIFKGCRVDQSLDVPRYRAIITNRSKCDLSALRFGTEYDIPHLVPIDDEVSYDEVASKTGLRVPRSPYFAYGDNPQNIP